ncbi:serine protease family S10, partial [Thraustotheca clavata]
GIAIGNGMTDTVTQIPYTADMARNNGYIDLVSADEFDKLKAAAATCGKLVEQCQTNDTICLQATAYWGDNVLGLMLNNTNVTGNPYDIREDCTNGCIDHVQYAAEFLNNPLIQSKLHVNKTWTEVSQQVYLDFSTDFMKNYVSFVPDVLAHDVRVMIYAGDADLMCNWIGNQAWTKALEWPGKAAFNNATVKPLLVNGKKSGEVRATDMLSFVRVYNAGHMVPMDQPEVSLELVNRFFSNSHLDQ